jgi:hypothetical protein
MRLRGVLLVLLALVFGAGAVAAEQSARQFLGAIYAAYKGKDAKGIRLDGARATTRYFTPSLARMIDADARAARGEVGQLGADPFIDAQDYEIMAVTIDVKHTGPDKAVGTVRFRNFDQNQTITLDLVKLKQGWRIDEIRAPTTGSLRALFKKR